MTGQATFVGVRHHSPACARLVRAVIERERPAHVLVEGPADMNERLDELLLGHELPVAIFSSYRDEHRAHASWSPFCDYSPEWVALTEGRRAGARVRFIDLPAWHPALAGRRNRYADAERRYARAIDRLCEVFAVDNVDTLWDHLFEVAPAAGLDERLAAYFDLVRGDSPAGDDDAEREAYMAAWVRAALADAGDRPVLVVTGGFHRPAVAALAAGAPPGAWPDVPALPEGAIGGSYVIPFSYRRLDAFDGYQSGMPSPMYYHRLWERDAAAAADGLVAAVVARLRGRRQPVSTADLVAARTLASGLARLRGHDVPARVDVLDGLLSALVTDPLDLPAPWTGRGRLREGTDPAVVEMVAALSGDRVGRLHPETPLPPLVHDADAERERLGVPAAGSFTADLTTDVGLRASRLLHRLRVLAIPGLDRLSGPALDAEPELVERWALEPSELRLPRLIEAGAYGATLPEAAGAALEERLATGGAEAGAVAAALFDAALCGLAELSARVGALAARRVASAPELAELGAILRVALGLWRHDRVLGAAGSPDLAAVVAGAVRRALWLAEGVRGGGAPADLGRLAAVAAVRDALLHASSVLDVGREAAVDVFDRLAADPDVPPDLRGAALGLGWALGRPADAGRAARAAARPDVLGDWLAGLFAVAREEVVASDGGRGLVTVLDELVAGMTEADFLVALPALRQAFAFFPPAERETIARLVLDLRGAGGSARSLLRLAADPADVAWAREVEARVDETLRREALLSSPSARRGEGDR
jgi:hypothetical protein